VRKNWAAQAQAEASMPPEAAIAAYLALHPEATLKEAARGAACPGVTRKELYNAAMNLRQRLQGGRHDDDA